MKTVHSRRGRVTLSTLLALAAVALGACAAPAEQPSFEEESAVATTSDALRNGGPDPDTCMASYVACIQPCKGNSSCYRYCDMEYRKCMGLPPLENAFTARATAATTSTAQRLP